MLEIFNKLRPFFEDCYREIGVREFSREIGISPPTASVFLKESTKEGYFIGRQDRGLLLFRINRSNDVLMILSKLYWQEKLRELVDFVEEELMSKTIILFGSLVKLEVTKNSDIDLVVISKHKKELNFSKFEKKLDRKIQVFYEKDMSFLPIELKKNVINGFVLRGRF